jgi:hypothetical protein
MRAIPVVLALLLAPAVVSGQPVPLPELTDRVINLPTHLTIGASTMQLLFTHRFAVTVQGAGSDDLWGLDTGADIGIGFDVGLGASWQASIYRSSFYDEIEGSLKWSALRQGDSSPLGLAVRAGADWRGAEGIDEQWSAFAQAIVARRFGNFFDLFLIPSYASDTPTLTNAFNVGLAASLHLPRRWDVSLEVMPENRDAESGELAWALGITKRVRGHEFLIYLGNSRATTTDLLVGTDFPGGYETSDVRLGFNLARRFPE